MRNIENPVSEQGHLEELVNVWPAVCIDSRIVSPTLPLWTLGNRPEMFGKTWAVIHGSSAAALRLTGAPFHPKSFRIARLGMGCEQVMQQAGGCSSGAGLYLRRLSSRLTTGLLKRSPFCNHLKHGFFHTRIKGNHHLGNVQVYSVRIPVQELQNHRGLRFLRAQEATSACAHG